MIQEASFWLTGGLTFAAYFDGLHMLNIITQIKNYSEQFLDSPLLKPFLKNYTLSKSKFNEGFLFFSEYTIRNNIQQAPLTSKSDLIKFNERVSQPALVAHGIRYAYNYHGKEIINTAFKNQIGKVQSKTQLIRCVNNGNRYPMVHQRIFKQSKFN